MPARDLPFPLVLPALLLATGASLLAAMLLPAGPRGFAIAGLSLIKAALIVLGFMRLHRTSWALTIALIGYAVLLCTLAGLKIAITG
jgi:hypothetical protein